MLEQPILLPTAATPIERVLSKFDRQQISGFIEVAIALLDLADGDPDIEANGDEQDGSIGEDEFLDKGPVYCGPGCPIADPSNDMATCLPGPSYGIDQAGKLMSEEDASNDLAAGPILSRRGEW